MSFTRRSRGAAVLPGGLAFKGIRLIILTGCSSCRKTMRLHIYLLHRPSTKKIAVIMKRYRMRSRWSRLPKKILSCIKTAGCWLSASRFFALSVVNLLNGEATENGFEKAQAAGRRPFSCAGAKVLVVDDEEMNLVVARGVLGSYGIKMDTCLSGREVVERCKNNVYDIIFLDHICRALTVWRHCAISVKLITEGCRICL